MEHPLITYIEDPCADVDMDGFKKIKESFVEANMQHVQIGMKNIFRDTQLQKVTDVTLMKQLTEEEQRKLEE